MIGSNCSPGIPGTRFTRYPPHSGGGNYSFVFLLFLSIWLELFDGFRGFRGNDYDLYSSGCKSLPVHCTYPEVNDITGTGGYMVAVHIGESVSRFY